MADINISERQAGDVDQLYALVCEREYREGENDPECGQPGVPGAHGVGLAGRGHHLGRRGFSRRQRGGQRVAAGQRRGDAQG